MHEIENIDFSGDPDLIARITMIADRLLREMAQDAEEVENRDHALLERALVYAAEAEIQLADRDQQLAYLQDLSLTDELTGLLNRRGFSEHFRRALATAKRYGHEGMLLYCDLDNFKAINDTYGHAAGDQILRHIGTLLRESVRECDIVGRLGGDEFAIALIQSSWHNGAKRARTLQWQIENSRPSFDGTVLPLSISIGCEPFGPDDEFEDLICRADMAMYCCKRSKTTPISQVAAE